MKQEVKIGQTDYTVLILIRDTAGAPKTGLTNASAGIDVCYTRVETDNDVVLTAGAIVALATPALTDIHLDWGFLQVDATEAPGLYRLDIADGVFATGAWSAVVTLRATGIDPVHIEFVLVPSSPYVGVQLDPAQAATTFAALTVTGSTNLTGNVALADGISIAAPSTGNRPGVVVAGNGTGAGISITGGGTSGNGVTVLGGAPNGFGAYIQGDGSGDGLRIDASETGSAIQLIGGSTSGHGLKTIATTEGSGIYAMGMGAGAGLHAYGGLTGNGIEAAGGGTSGDGVYAKAAGTGHGLACHGGGVAGDGINAVADNDGDGVTAVGAGAGEYDVNADIHGTLDTVTTCTTTTTNTDIGALGIGLSAIPWNAAWDAEVQSECDDAITANALVLDIPTTAEFNARTLPSADYTIVADLGVVQTADHTAGIADIPTVAEFNARTIASADYTIVADLGVVQTADHTADITAIKAITDLLPSGIKKNTALTNFEFYMVLAADHISPALLKVVDCQRSIDGAAFANCNTAVATEVSAGIYKLNLAASDLNGDVITFKFTEAACDTRMVTIKTST